MQQWFLWKVRDMQVLRTNIHSKFANLLDFDTFLNIYHDSNDDSGHDFLMIDLNPTAKFLQFRKYFDHILIPHETATTIPNVGSEL